LEKVENCGKQNDNFPTNAYNEKIMDQVVLPNKKEFLGLYSRIKRKKYWMRILFLLAYIYGVKLSYAEMTVFTKETLLQYFETTGIPTSRSDFGQRFTFRKFDYHQELKNLMDLHFSKEKYLISKNGVVQTFRSVEQQLRGISDFTLKFSQSIVFIRYLPNFTSHINFR
jgi:hypothetical protein